MNTIRILLFGALLVSTPLIAGNDIPWQNPQVNAINREPIHAHFISHSTEEAAINKETNTDRCVSLAGTWKFLYSKTPELCPKDFYRTNYNSRKWKNIQVPGSWEL
ncbi:MAG: hypothetical protein RSA92_06785, partial [Bacteroidaceae bacterium]